MKIWERLKSAKGAVVMSLMALLLSSAMAFAASYPFNGVVTSDTNMRSTANSYESNVIRRIPEGDSVYVLSESGNFYRIQYDGKTGYVFKSYVKQTAGTSSSGSGFTAEGYPYQTVTTSSVNLRKSASTSAKRLTTIPKGADITVHQLSGSWAKVTYSSYSGWVMKDYIRVATIVTVQPGPTARPDDLTTSYQLLQSGSDGTQVTALQEALIELGYLTGKADGIYGSGTANAVMKLQKANGYPVTGYADANLQALIFNGKPVNSRGVKTAIKTLPAIDGITVRSGDKGVLVRSIQTQLKALGFYTGSISGTCDSATVNAIKAFQKKHNLTADGVAGEATQTLLFGGGASSSGSTATPKPTPTSTPLPSFQKPTSTVRKDSKGNDAKLVQQRLIDLKYLTGKADGIFGSQSVAALKAFQQKNKLIADGVAGAGTNAVLFSYMALAADYQPIATTVPTATPKPENITQDNVVVIKLGVTGSEVLRLQKRLQELGYYTSAKDSRCKADDVAAIRAFQKKNGLDVDGVAGYDTQVLLYSTNAIMDNGQLAGSLGMSYETLKKGMYGDEVKAMQNRLIELGYLSGKADGYYGTDTAEAVYYFQKTNGLVRDGIAGEKTLIKLYATNAVKNPETSATATPTAKPTTPPATITTALMRKGDSNESVKIMQQKLISLGYLTGTADGVFGNKTFTALKEFQKANALYADGIAGQSTIAALNKVGNTAPEVTTKPSGGSASIGGVMVSARNVKYELWYAKVRNECRKYPYCTIYDPESGLAYQVHMFSYGKHAEIEPLTAKDTKIMYEIFGGQSWTPKPVWVIFADGTIRIATTHSVPHEVQHIRDNDFPGHSCLHFPRTMGQVTAIGPYATKHQNTVDKAWAELQTKIN